MNAARPAISVGLPVYNGEAFLARAIDSVLAQDFADFELVVCDNGSTDATERICRDYAARDARVRYQRNERNLGAAGNFCRVFELSGGRYFRWLAADDTLGGQALRIGKQVLDERPDVVLCTGRVDIVDERGERICAYAETQAAEQREPVDRFRAVVRQDPWCNAIYGLIRRDALARTRLMGDFVSSDAILLAGLSLHGRFAEVPELVLCRRFHANAYSYDPQTIAYLQKAGVQIAADERAQIPAAERVRRFYNPDARHDRSTRLNAARHVYEYTRASLRADLTFAQRLAVWGAVAKMGWWSRAELAREILGLAGFRLRRSA